MNIYQRFLKIPVILIALPFVGSVEAELFSPEPPDRPSVWLDYYHHVKPGTKVGEHLVTGGWADNVGRYGWDDFVHSNSFDPLLQALESEFALNIEQKAFTKEDLQGTDIIVIINPDLPEMVPGAARISDDEIAALVEFVESGGSIIAMINSGGHPSEKFEARQLGKLLGHFGISWNEDDTKYSDIEIGPYHPYFYDMDVFHYGAGCTLNILEHAQDPKVLLQVYEDDGYGDLEVDGPGLVQVSYGKGKVMVVGDTGAWGANMSRPWAENQRFLLQMFRRLKPNTLSTQIAPDGSYTGEYLYKTAQLLAIPVKNPMGNIDQPGFRSFKPREKTTIPYRETTATIRAKIIPDAEDNKFNASFTFTDFRNFDETWELPDDNRVSVSFGRLGTIGDYVAQGEVAAWAGTDFLHLISFIPNKAIRPGDRWKKIQSLRVPSVKGADIPKIKPVEVTMTYMGDESVSGRHCLKIRSSTVSWLSDLDVGVEDILPPEVLRDQWPDNSIGLYNGRGGRLLYRLDQWIDKDSGMIVKAKAQTRIAAWIEDKSIEIGPTNASIDNHMITITTHVAEFELLNVK